MEKQKIPWASIAIVIVSALMMTFALRAPQLLSHASEDQLTPVTQNLGSHTYVLRRDLIEMIYKPDYSGATNPNPNRPHDPVVRLAVQWPEFTASIGGNSQEKAKRKIIISLIAGAVRTVAQDIESLNALHYLPEIIDAPYGLKELRSGLAKHFHEYIASPEAGPEYLIHWDQDDGETITKLYYSCNYDFEYFDLKINVYFKSPFLNNWREIHQKTVALLNSVRRD